MTEQVVYAAGDGKYRVELMVSITGDGLVAHLYGGDKPHVGAVAISLTRPSISDNTKVSCNTSVIPLLGHKDDEVAKPIAEKIALAFGKPVVVVVGIHVDNAGPEEIKKIMENCNYVAQIFIDGHRPSYLLPNKVYLDY
ncbi:hypothetical protein L9W92_12775 [Pelotomaculum terephthalicicum JT]|uniref:prenylated flavin chaperone LpdD n=1 Tax=Pelotomaculum TaxID=191373 RepID=UPI0009D1E089|nr:MULTISPECIES: hypothetical protein [Pelotomaculum]MCG9968908.1 hypothetical protein [Pelotomaculum terephthalicicum JT]OPX85804.1 MAG: hypothetical protein A4E54_02224 [Pelotomaculum sp. PtaB.Bin117]OPY63955.1 MAG: hypothetical protein A4E56_00003 [Pelotomaculum sp. PtaU1.Bin065]